jgi:quercetin dioxygenase-like cupin family protein
MAAPVVIDESERPPETWPRDEAGGSWKTLISANLTPSEALTLGVARLGPGETLGAHRHAQPEVYLVLAGSGVVTVGGESREIGPGSAVFIPGDAVHSLACAGEAELRIAYVLAADSMDDVEYEFLASQGGSAT